MAPDAPCLVGHPVSFDSLLGQYRRGFFIELLATETALHLGHAGRLAV